MNRFLEILQHARDNKWCMNLECSACGAMEYRIAMKQLGDELANELADVNLNELTRIPNWVESLRLVLNDIRDADQMDRILTAWLPQLDRHMILADVILFYYVRRGAIFAPMSIEVLRRWREKCIDLAVSTQNESLIESLIYTYKDYSDYPDLDLLAQDLARQGSKCIIKALMRRGVEIPTL